MPEPLTVLDTLGRPMRDLRISVTDRCNFRCVYCMPKEVFGRDHAFLPRAEILDFEEIERVVRAAVALGVRKVRLTGGSHWCGGTSRRWSECSRRSTASTT